LVREKPFYLRDPWEILFKETKLDKTSPWSIDLVYLLTTLLEEMNRVGIDFRMAGTAINSSVLIYLKKAELLLKMEEPPKPPQEKPDVYVPPPLTLPFRFEFTTTSLSDLIKALEQALTEGRRSRTPRLPVLPTPIPDFLDMEAYLLEIQERAEDLLGRIKRMGGGPLSLFALVTECNLLEVVRTFMLLLFLAQENEIDLQQDEEEMDIMIMVKEFDGDE
jgi:chromatin segregation and condensation protein Rec8/ScpA/Scc1 (kleisin family)